MIVEIQHRLFKECYSFFAVGFHGGREAGVHGGNPRFTESGVTRCCRRRGDAPAVDAAADAADTRGQREDAGLRRLSRGGGRVDAPTTYGVTFSIRHQVLIMQTNLPER